MEINTLQNKINILELDVSDHRSEVSQFNIISEKKKRIIDDLDHQLDYLRKAIREGEAEIAHGIERKLPIEIEKEYEYSQTQITIKQTKIEELMDLLSKLEAICGVDNSADFKLQEESLRIEISNHISDYKIKIKSLEKELSSISSRIIEINND